MTRSQKKLWIGLFILALLTPVGVILPEIFGAGGGWGEWGPGELGRLIGYMPEGLGKMAGIWKAPVHDYTFFGGADTTIRVLSYAASGLIGISAIAIVIYIIARTIKGNGK